MTALIEMINGIPFVSKLIAKGNNNAKSE